MLSSPSDRPTANSRTRVVHVSLGTNVGGMERLLVEFARYTDRERFALTFVSLEQRGSIAHEIEGLNYTVHDFHKSPGLRPGLVWKLARLLRKLRPDVVHTHNTAAFFYGSLAANVAQVPTLIHTRHGQRFGASPRETLVFRTLSKLAQRIISVSEDGRALSEVEGVPAHRTATIHNGIDLTRFPYSGPREGGPAMLVARLSAEKDVASLIHAMKWIANAAADDQEPLRLTIVGDGGERVALEQLSQNLHLGDTIRFLGERNDVPDLLACGSMFVLPSKTEGISLTLLEAMARGLPVVATRVGGNPEVVIEEETGLLVPVADPRALAEAMLRLKRDSQLAQRMSLAGRQRVEQHFSVTEMIRQYERCYHCGDLR